MKVYICVVVCLCVTSARLCNAANTTPRSGPDFNNLLQSILPLLSSDNSSNSSLTNGVLGVVSQLLSPTGGVGGGGDNGGAAAALQGALQLLQQHPELAMTSGRLGLQALGMSADCSSDTMLFLVSLLQGEKWALYGIWLYYFFLHLVLIHLMYLLSI